MLGKNNNKNKKNPHLISSVVGGQNLVCRLHIVQATRPNSFNPPPPKNFFGPNILLDQKLFWICNSSKPNFVYSKYIFWPKIIWTQKILDPIFFTQFFLSKIFLDPNFFSDTNFCLIQSFLDPKFLWSPKLFWTQSFSFLDKVIFDKFFFRP